MGKKQSNPPPPVSVEDRPNPPPAPPLPKYLDIPQVIRRIWTCPRCDHEQDQRGDNTVWCGKRLQCDNCKEYSFYSDWKIN